MSVLIIKNIAMEGSRNIEEFLRRKDIPLKIVDLSSGDTHPHLEKFDTLVMIGGPMSVYELDKYPHLVTGSRIIREAINRDMSVLGICLGCQMIAYFLGADV